MGMSGIDGGREEEGARRLNLFWWFGAREGNSIFHIHVIRATLVSRRLSFTARYKHYAPRNRVTYDFVADDELLYIYLGLQCQLLNHT